MMNHLRKFNYFLFIFNPNNIILFYFVVLSHTPKPTHLTHIATFVSLSHYDLQHLQVSLNYLVNSKF